MTTKNQESINSKFYAVIDPILFLLCLFNLALWLNRILYIRQDHVYWLFTYLAEQWLLPMKISLYVLPLLILLSLINRKLQINTFPFLSIKCLAITLFMLFIIR
jgi:hypothetical protein